MKRIITQVRKSILYSFVVVLIASLASCSSYKVITYPDYEEQEIADLQNPDSKYIVHQNDKVYILAEATTDSTSISGTLNSIDKDQIYYTANDDKKTFKSKEKGISKEIHIYLKNNTSQLQQGQTTIPFNKVEEVKYIKKDLKALGYVIGGLAVGMFVLLLI